MTINEQPRSGKRGRRSSFPDWAYLFFLVFLFIAPAFNPEAGVGHWLAAGVIAVVSGALYLYAFVGQRHQLPAAVMMLVIGLVGTLVDTAAMGVLPIYAAALAACEGERRQVFRRLLVITAVTAAAIPLSDIPFPYLFLMFGPALALIWLVGLAVFQDMERNLETDALRAENARIEYLATVTERERIARDLHDLAGQALTAISLRSQLVQRLAESDPERVRAEAAAIETTARETLASLRETVAGWQQILLDDELAKAVDALEAADVEVEVEGDWQPDLAPSVESVLALALREGVTNVVRHARASSCRISLDGAPGEVALSVRDDGVGPGRREGSGLRGMRERVSAAGGTVERSDADPGTDLRVSIPVVTA